MQARTSIEPIEGGRNQIIVTELPYQVIKARLIEQIADLVKQKKIEGIADLNDYSDRTGMKIVITLKREAYPEESPELPTQAHSPANQFRGQYAGARRRPAAYFDPERCLAALPDAPARSDCSPDAV